MPDARVEPVAARRGASGRHGGGEDVPGDLPQFITTDFETPRARDDDESDVGSPWLSVSQRMPRGQSAAAAMLAARRAIAEAHAADAARRAARSHRHDDHRHRHAGDGDDGELTGGGGFAFKVGPSGAAPVVYTVTDPEAADVREQLVVPDPTSGGGGGAWSPTQQDNDNSDAAKVGQVRRGVSSATLTGMAANVVGASFRALLTSGQLGAMGSKSPADGTLAEDAGATDSPGSGGASGSAGAGRDSHTLRTWAPPSDAPGRSPASGAAGRSGIITGGGGAFESRPPAPGVYAVAPPHDSVGAAAVGLGRPTIGASGAGLGDVKLSVPAPRRRRPSMASSSGRSAGESPTTAARGTQAQLGGPPTLSPLQQQMQKAEGDTFGSLHGRRHP